VHVSIKLDSSVFTSPGYPSIAWVPCMLLSTSPRIQNQSPWPPSLFSPEMNLKGLISIFFHWNTQKQRLRLYSLFLDIFVRKGLLLSNIPLVILTSSLLEGLLAAMTL
jgi:hypothetical protein